jgi:hypothetical protein
VAQDSNLWSANCSIINTFTQAADFGGWPELEELPLKHMTKEHLEVLAAKCSSQANIEMPIFPELATASPSGTAASDFSNTVTPGPRAQVDPDAAYHDMTTITPSPGFALKEANANKAAAKTKPPVSKKQLEMHQQWQATAESMGGPNARIIVSKSDAKKLIFDALHDAFAPMNITDLHRVRIARNGRCITRSCYGKTRPLQQSYSLISILYTIGPQRCCPIAGTQAMPQRYDH